MIPFRSMSLMWGAKSPLQVEWEGRESFGGFTDHLHVRPFVDDALGHSRGEGPEVGGVAES